MSQTVVLAPTTAAAQTDPIAVAAGEVVSVCVHGDLTADFQAMLYRVVDDDLSPVTVDGRPFVATIATRDFALTAPGTYVLDKQPTKDAVGVVIDR